MILSILRAIFVLLIAAVGWHFVVDVKSPLGDQTWLAMAIALTVGVLAVCIDILAPRRKLSIFAGTFFGLLVGIVTSYALSFVVQLLVGQFGRDWKAEQQVSMTSFVTMVVGCVTTYFSISFVLQTKDDFRFIIPYVEFRRSARGAKPLLLDTSVLIDGRIFAIVAAGVFESQLIVPRFVLVELQQVADSPDKLKRARGRRGLEVLAKLQQSPRADLITYDSPARETDVGVDQRLITLAKETEARLITTDYNLAKVAELAGVSVVNINELVTSLKPEALPGERVTVKIVKPGESAGQGVGYLDDGTMVVIEQGRQYVGQEVEFSVTNTVQTSAGKMIFGRMGDHPGGRRERTAASQ